MPLPYWEVLAVDVDIQHWGYTTAYLLHCTRCKNSFVVPKAWARKNTYGTAPCPFCFKSSRIPKPRKHSV